MEKCGGMDAQLTWFEAEGCMKKFNTTQQMKDNFAAAWIKVI